MRPLGAPRAVACDVSARILRRGHVAVPLDTRCARRHGGAAAATSGGSGSSDSRAEDGSGMQGVSVAVTPDERSNAGAGGKDALLARIARAKAYKDSSSGASSASQQDAPLSDEQQEALRQQYVDQLRAAQQQVSAQGSSYNELMQQQAQQQQERATDAGSLQKKTGGSAGDGSAGDDSGGSALDRLQQQDPTPGARPQPARADFYTSRDAPAPSVLLASSPRRAGAGSADEAASWLAGVLATPDSSAAATDPTLRPEEFTAAKQAMQRQRGADIITAFPDELQGEGSSLGPGAPNTATDAAGGSSQTASAGDATDSDYKPRVTTWGVFPRPQNISAAYGGGRDIKPGQALESADQKAKREAEYAKALARYKAATFTDTLSEAELAAAQKSFERGMTLFKRGALREALVIFDEVREKVPLKSKLGGLSTLQAAVCYDTLGNARTAEALYKRIRGHPTSEVSRKARQLVFGFAAQSFLKTEGLSYAVKKDEYLKYFRRGADRNRLYVASEEERAADAAEARVAAAVAAGVVLGPVLLMGALLASSRAG